MGDLKKLSIELFPKGFVRAKLKKPDLGYSHFGLKKKPDLGYSHFGLEKKHNNSGLKKYKLLIVYSKDPFKNLLFKTHVWILKGGKKFKMKSFFILG
jgi:hypothetical protein